MNVLFSLYALLAVIILVLLAVLGVWGADLHYLFGVVIPYAAAAVFIIGIIYRVLKWARSAVPYRITTTCGQQKTLPWIKSSPLESPSGLIGVLGRMALEILVFRSLFRNTKTDLREQRLIFGDEIYLWIAALAFHWSMLVILLRHLRFFTEPVPIFVGWMQTLDGFFQIGVPILYTSDLIIVGGLTYLFIRRVIYPQIRYISLPSDYFALFLILGVAVSGILMRYFFKVDLIGVKELSMNLLSFNPALPERTIGIPFYVHFFLVSALFAYFPFSKLLHMAGVFLSPTRNLANNNRMRRHVNPWDYPVKVHTYEEWEDEFRDKIRDCGLPLEKE